MQPQNTMTWWIASGLGTGRTPRAPGTAGSVLGIAIGALLLKISPVMLLAGTAAATAAGLWAISALPDQDAIRRDPGWIVIDEVAGQMLALGALPHPTPAGLLAAFALFRVFDIFKPWPIAWIDRHSGAFFIMADDLAAGAAAACVLILARHFG